MTSKGRLCVLCGVIAALTISYAFGAGEAAATNEVLRMRAVKQDGGAEAIEMSVGDMLLTAPSLTVRHREKPNSTVRALNGRIQVRRGTNSFSAEEVSVSLHQGPWRSR